MANRTARSRNGFEEGQVWNSVRRMVSASLMALRVIKLGPGMFAG
jgi:hypothetical protein